MRRQILEQQIAQSRARLNDLTREAGDCQSEVRKWRRAGDERRARLAESSLKACLKKQEALMERIRLLRTELASLRE